MFLPFYPHVHTPTGANKATGASAWMADLEAEAHLQVDGAHRCLVAIEELSRQREGLVKVLTAYHIAWLRQVDHVEDVVRRNCEVQVVSAPHRVGVWTAEETTTTAA